MTPSRVLIARANGMTTGSVGLVRNLPLIGELTSQGFGASQCARHLMNSLSAGDAIVTVAIMTSAFLIEVAVFALVGMF